MRDTIAATAESSGCEVLVYDYNRRPRDWSEIILPHQCAVFLQNRRLGASVNRDGKPRTQELATCILFDSIDEAEAFCHAAVNAKPDLSCRSSTTKGQSIRPC